jgi:hypothetical protein
MQKEIHSIDSILILLLLDPLLDGIPLRPPQNCPELFVARPKRDDHRQPPPSPRRSFHRVHSKKPFLDKNARKLGDKGGPTGMSHLISIIVPVLRRRRNLHRARGAG